MVLLLEKVKERHCLWTKKDNITVTHTDSKVISGKCRAETPQQQKMEATKKCFNQNWSVSFHHVKLWQTNRADQEAANLFYYSLDTLQRSWSPIDIYYTCRQEAWLISLDLPTWHLCLTLHTNCWLVIPLSMSSTNQGPDYNHTYQIPARRWATEINKGIALFFKLGFHLKYYIIF